MIFLNGTENNRLVYGMFIHMYHTVLIFTWISRRYLRRTLNAENITQSTTTALGIGLSRRLPWLNFSLKLMVFKMD